jgi:glycosyltransferase involved in cell wall biosynthesis
MNSPGLPGLLERLRHELRYGWPDVRSTLAGKRKERQLRKWLGQLTDSPPQVLLGANIDENGGVRQHLLGLRKYSTHSVEFAPPDWLRLKLSYHDFHTVFRRQFFEYRPDGVRAIHSHVFPYFIEWCAAKRSSSTKWIHTYHAPYFPEYGRNELEAWQIEINHVLIDVASHADMRVSVSRWQQAYLRDEHGIDTLYVPNGVDVEVCDEARASRFIDRYKLENFVLYVGRNDPVKNPVDFVRLAEKIPGKIFVMIGPGLSADTMLSDWGINSPRNLHFVGGLPRAQVQDAIAASAAVVITSKREGLPTLVLEAMTHRKPVIVPNDPGCVEATDNGRLGFVFAHGALDDMASMTLGALEGMQDFEAGRAFVLSGYDWRVVAPQLDALYSATNA